MHFAMNPNSRVPNLSRREWLGRTALGFGSLALAGLMQEEGLLSAAENVADEEPPVAVPQGTRKARSVIFLFMGGGPGQMDTFDPKPELARLHGLDVPESIAASVPRIARSPLNNLMASPFSFTRHGESGIEVSELYPELGRCIDDLCVLRSCRHDSPIHAPAEFIATTGTQVGDRPSLGAWLYYGLGSENHDLPGFIVFKAGETIRPPAMGAGFLPARYQGTLVDAVQGIPNLDLPAGTSLQRR